MPSRATSAGLLTALGWGRRDAVAVVVVAVAAVAFLINVLFMQSGPHPAPTLKGKPTAARPAVVTENVLPPATTTPPKPRAVEPVRAIPITATPLAPVRVAPAPVAANARAADRTPGMIITDIQRELARRGFFDGAVDGFHGPKTDRAIRDFEQAAGLKIAPEPSEALLQAIQHAPARVAKAQAAAAPASRPGPVRNDVAAERPAPSRRVIAMQRVLADFGYGQIKPTGLIDPETQAAIEKFERERRLPVTGQASDRVVRELVAVTGRPLD